MSTRFMLAGPLALCLIGSSPAPAQTAAVPAQDTLAAARELVVVLQSTDQVKQILPSMVQALRPVVVRGNPQAEQDFDAFAPALVESMSARSAELVEQITLIYARNFTAEEMRQATAFYGTPAGQKLLQKMPTVTQESMAAGQSWGQKIGEEVQTRLVEELQKKGHNP